MLEIKNLFKNYKDINALSDINLSIGRGEIVGLFGENGAGKTTLMKCILGLIKSNSGDIILDGKAVTKNNIEKLTYATCEHSYFPNLSPILHKEFYMSQFKNFNETRFNLLMEFFDLPMEKPVKSFSTGQKNQIEVILALSQGADYILMDEPFAGNDIFNREDFYKLLLGLLEPRETVILSTHLIDEVDNFIDRAVLIHKGKIIADESKEKIDEDGLTLSDFIKNNFNYRRDRVSKSIEKIRDELDSK